MTSAVLLDNALDGAIVIARVRGDLEPLEIASTEPAPSPDAATTDRRGRR